MIAYIDIKVNAAHPNIPLAPFYAFVGSPSSVRVIGVPQQVGKWEITKVYISANYPDNTVQSRECELVGGVWVGTLPACAVVGRSLNGFEVQADGIDESGNAVTGYVLGKGDLDILDGDGTITPGVTTHYVHIVPSRPDNPQNYDVYCNDGAWMIYYNGAWSTLIGASAPASDSTPQMDGTASPGESGAYARGDHVHPKDSSKQDVIQDLSDIRSNASAGAAAAQALPGVTQAVVDEEARAEAAEQSLANGKADKATTYTKTETDGKISTAVSAEAQARDAAIANAINAVKDSAPEAFDTLKEIADWIGDDQSGAAAMAAQISSHTSQLSQLSQNKVDKVAGKGLSTNDFTNVEKEKLAGVAPGANNYILPKASASTLGGVKVGANLSIDANGVLSADAQSVTVDDELDGTSENPVQNKVVKEAIDEKPEIVIIDGYDTWDYPRQGNIVEMWDGIENSGRNSHEATADTGWVGVVRGLEIAKFTNLPKRENARLSFPATFESDCVRLQSTAETLSGAYLNFFDRDARDALNYGNDYKPTSAYAVGAKAVYDGKLYTCNTAIASPGEEWNPGHWDYIGDYVYGNMTIRDHWAVTTREILRIDALGDHNQNIIQWAIGGEGPGGRVGILNGNVILQAGRRNGGNAIQMTIGAVESGMTLDLAVVYENVPVFENGEFVNKIAKSRFFVNGVLYGINNAPADTYTGSFDNKPLITDISGWYNRGIHLNTNDWNNSGSRIQPWSPDISFMNLACWNRGLTDGEIARMHAIDKARFGLEA